MAGSAVKAKARRERWIGVASLLLSLAALNGLASEFFFRWDLTEKKEYTLSRSTKGLLQNLDDLVGIRVYFTKNPPPVLLPLKGEVEARLDEFKRYAGAKLRVEYLNPDGSPEEERAVQQMGIAPLTVNVIQKDKRELAKVYLGMAVNFGEKQEVIPVVQTVGNLEYELAASILKVTTKEKPVLGWYATDNVRGGESTPGLELVKGELRRRYTVQEIIKDNLPDITAKDFKTVLLFLGEEPPAEMAPLVEEYLEQKQGKVIAFIEPVQVGEGLNAGPRAGSFRSLFAKQGIEVEQNLVLDGVSSAMASFSSGIVTYHVPYAYWPKIRSEGFSKESPVTSPLESLILPWPSALKITTSEEKPVTILARTTPQGAKEEVVGPAVLDPNRIHGVLGATPKEEVPLIALGGDNLMVVGSLRLVRDEFFRQFPENRVFFENAVDSLALGGQLIGIRSKGVTSRPLHPLSDGERVATKTLNMVIPPALLVGIGSAIYLARRNRFRALQLAFQAREKA